MPQVTGTTVERLAYTSGALYTITPVVDAAGNVFECIAVNDGLDRGFALVLKRNAAGVVVDRLEMYPNGTMKVDGAGCMQSGADIHVYAVNHMPGAQNPEQLTVDKYVWRGVAAPYAPGRVQLAAEGAYAPEEGQQGGGGVTIEELVAELTNSQSDLHKAMARLVKNNAQIGADNALDQQGLTPEHIKGEVEELFGRLEEGGSTIVAQRIENEAYEGSIEAHKISRDAQEENN
jgi:hypothetical protein